MANTRSEPPRAITRMGLIGDVHTERARLAGVLAHFGKLGLDLVACTGDIADGPNDAREVDACVALLRDARVTTVSGNHERWLQDAEMRDLPGATNLEDLSPETLDWLAALPHKVELATPRGLALLCHGLGEDDMAGVKPHDHGYALENNGALQELLHPQRYRYVLNGHTHWPMVRTLGELTIVNAGTLLGDHNPCCLVIDFAGRAVHFYAVDAQGAVTPDRHLAL